MIAPECIRDRPYSGREDYQEVSEIVEEVLSVLPDFLFVAFLVYARADHVLNIRQDDRTMTELLQRWKLKNDIGVQVREDHTPSLPCFSEGKVCQI
jgi:hypothetical protein